jgi:hypothetical protein
MLLCIEHTVCAQTYSNYSQSLHLRSGLILIPPDEWVPMPSSKKLRWITEIKILQTQESLDAVHWYPDVYYCIPYPAKFTQNLSDPPWYHFCQRILCRVDPSAPYPQRYTRYTGSNTEASEASVQQQRATAATTFNRLSSKCSNARAILLNA